MVSTIEATDRLWQLLWSQAAHQIIERLHQEIGGELASAGHGWGLRLRGEPNFAVLLYPSGESRAIGDLSLLIQGHGTQPIPRYGHSYPSYIAVVEDVVATVAAAYLRTSHSTLPVP